MSSDIYTFTGKRVNPLSMRPEDFDIEDIAHALSNTCRYSGHCSEFYSVAQHSVLMAEYAPTHLKFPALMHDAAEAYITDMPRPLKHGTDFGIIFQAIEDDILDVAFRAYNIDPGVMDEIEPWDRWMLAWEQRDLMPMSHKDGEWFPGQRIPPQKITGWTPKDAKLQFLAAFGQLVDGVLIHSSGTVVA